MGLISRVSSRTYRKTSTYHNYHHGKGKQSCRTTGRGVQHPNHHLRAEPKSCRQSLLRNLQPSQSHQQPRPRQLDQNQRTTTNASQANEDYHQEDSCGEGSKTWDRYQMRIHKRVIEFVCGQSQILNITQVQLEPGVHVELTLPEQ